MGCSGFRGFGSLGGFGVSEFWGVRVLGVLGVFGVLGFWRFWGFWGFVVLGELSASGFRGLGAFKVSTCRGSELTSLGVYGFSG